MYIENLQKTGPFFSNGGGGGRLGPGLKKFCTLKKPPGEARAGGPGYGKKFSIAFSR